MTDRSRVEDVRWIELPSQRDGRGVLTVVEGESLVPFAIQRVFWVHDVSESRGGHAHRDTDQLIVAVSGRLDVSIFDGAETVLHTLDDPTRGLYVPRMLFTELLDFTPGAVCLVLASTHYDMGRSLRSRDAYLEAVSSA